MNQEFQESVVDMVAAFGEFNQVCEKFSATAKSLDVEVVSIAKQLARPTSSFFRGAALFWRSMTSITSLFDARFGLLTEVLKDAQLADRLKAKLDAEGVPSFEEIEQLMTVLDSSAKPTDDAG